MMKPLTGFVGSLALGLTLMQSLEAYAQSAQANFWKQYVEACDPSSFVNEKAYFFGATNTYGPGSTFGLRGGTTNPIARASSYFGLIPPPVAPGKIADCRAIGNRTWSITLGVPIVMNANRQAINLSAALSSATSIAISIANVAVDAIPISDWEDAADKLPLTAHAFTDIVDGSHRMMSAGVAVEGIKITYTLETALSAGITAQVQQRAIQVGTANNPAQFKVTISPNGRIVTLESKERVYLLGQLLKIRKIPQKEIDSPTGARPRISVDSIPESPF
jgi:hypothetical protein